MRRHEWIVLIGVVSSIVAGCTDRSPLTPTSSTGTPPPISAAPPIPTFVVQDITPAADQDGFARDINDQGAVVGWSNTTTGQHAWVIQNGQVTWLVEPPDALGSEGWAISGSGHIAGTILYPDTAKPAYWASATSQPVVALVPGSFKFGDALGVNDNGLVAVTVFNDFTRRAIVWNTVSGSIADIGTLGGPTAQANAINNQDVVVGCAEGPFGSHPYTWTSGGGMVDLLPGSSTGGCVYKINARAVSGGFLDDAIVGAQPTTFDAPGSFASFIEPNALDGTVRSLDRKGASVGYWVVSGLTTAFFHDRQAVDLPPLVPGNDAQAWGINKAGVIVGYGTGPTGHTSALMWCPRRC